MENRLTLIRGTETAMGARLYVFLQDGTLLNAEIIKGSGPCIYGLPFGRTGEFRRLDLKR
jgi:hypothetical protein